MELYSIYSYSGEEGEKEAKVKISSLFKDKENVGLHTFQDSTQEHTNRYEGN